MRDLLRGKTGPVRDAVLLNAAAGLVAYDGPGDDLTGDLRAAYARAAEAVDSGRAAQTLERWIEISSALGGKG